jgi:hypothetical protein
MAPIEPTAKLSSETLNQLSPALIVFQTPPPVAPM